MTTPARVSTEPPIVPDTPHERELRKQVNDLHAKMAKQRAHYEGLITQMKQARGLLPKPEPETLAATLRASEQRVTEARTAENKVRAENEQLRLRISALEARVAAGAERRKDAIICLNALLTCEDDDLTDEAWEKRMDTVVKHARRIVSAERASILKERDSKQGS